MDKKRENNGLDESLRRLSGILASPSLVLSYEHTTPLLERSWLRRLGLDKRQADEFMDLLCQHGLLDQGARSVIEAVCVRRRVTPAEAAALLLQGEDWPEDGQPAGKGTDIEKQ
ncbi:MAG: hypothetical protein LUH36_03475 [Oscillospiraceae bacterium]|nr:hypothetical protein [Oscillospiraceae bacterium]MCD8116816.1 hypothetical protein [Oscillospiraceae bacterium]